jgi:3-oxoacyl-[acyl-carrier-protein] synthase II
MERVFVTGMGLASPLGCTIKGFWAGLLEGCSGVVLMEHEAFARQRTRIGAPVKGFNPEEYFDRKEARHLNRSSQMAIVAATQAIVQADLMQGAADLEQIAVLVSSSIGGFSASDASFRDFYLKGRAGPLTIPLSMNNGPSSNISIRFGFRGPLLCIDAACASAAHSIGYAYNLIRTGLLQIGICGGADSPFSPGVVHAWCALHALSERNDNPAEACRPFSADRDGLVLGEGAGVLVLESERSARRRGVRVLAEIKGYGATGDSYHLTQPTQEGPARAMRHAMKDAGLQPEQIDYINAHATGTQWNDKTETAAIKQALGMHSYRIPVVGNKAALGHSIGASGALELISCILSLRDQVVPPTINYKLPDPECDLDYVTERCRPHRVVNAMSNSFAFGGSNASLIVSKYQPSTA